MANKECVFAGCKRKAIAKCNNCGIPICSLHGRKVNNFYICVNCLKYLKKFGLK